jgi:hypothetical protein
MLKLIRKNPMIAAGIILPAVVALFFILATAVPRWLVEPPAYDFLFTHYDYRGSPPAVELRFDVHQQKLRARVFETKNSYGSVPRLLLYNASEGTVVELFVDVPGDAESFDDGEEVAIPDLANAKISTARTAPDGYSVNDPNYQNGGIMRAFFGGGRRQGLSISKSGAVVGIPDVGDDRYYYNNARFIGWITERS